MAFDDIESFLAMGKYGAYVWSSFGITMGWLVWNVVSASRQAKSLEKQIMADIEGDV